MWKWRGRGLELSSPKEKSAKSALKSKDNKYEHSLMSLGLRRKEKRRVRNGVKKWGRGLVKKETGKIKCDTIWPGCRMWRNQRHLWEARRRQWKSSKSGVHDYKKWRNLLSLCSWKPTPGLVWNPCFTNTDDTKTAEEEERGREPLMMEGSRYYRGSALSNSF